MPADGEIEAKLDGSKRVANFVGHASDDSAERDETLLAGKLPAEPSFFAPRLRETLGELANAVGEIGKLANVRAGDGRVEIGAEGAQGGAEGSGAAVSGDDDVHRADDEEGGCQSKEDNDPTPGREGRKRSDLEARPRESRGDQTGTDNEAAAVERLVHRSDVGGVEPLRNEVTHRRGPVERHRSLGIERRRDTPAQAHDVDPSGHRH